VSLSGLDKNRLANMHDEEFRTVLMTMHDDQRRDRKENQLLYYTAASTKAMAVHTSTSKVMGIGGGNGSGKTETALVEMIMLATGTIPDSLQDVPAVREKMRGPVKCRVICESLTTVLHPIMLPKLKWWEWSGISFPGGDKGHYGWVPRDCLIGGSWDKSWSEKLRMLRVYCRDPDNPEEIQGESTIQFMSKDQDPTDFASGDFHFVLFDEPSTYAIWRENEARTMRVNGRLMLAMTWPDDPSIPVDWIFSEIYDKAQEGPGKDPNVEWLNIWTTDNKNLDQEAVATQAASWSDEVRNVRIFGKPIRFSNQIHPLFTPHSDWWCFSCGKTVSPLEGKCATCDAKDILAFTHVAPFEPQQAWPTVWVLDPHPRKPHMFAWIQIDPSDDWWVIREGELDGDPSQLREYVDRVEADLGIAVARRLIDPNMGRSPASSARGVTWQDEFDKVGLVTDLADNSEVGRSKVNEMLIPDRHTRRPRLMVHPLCEKLIYQMGRFVWDDYRQSLEKGQKQKAKEKHDDYPAILRYHANAEPSFMNLREGNRIVRRGSMKQSRTRSTVRSPSYAGRI